MKTNFYYNSKKFKQNIMDSQNILTKLNQNLNEENN